MLNISMSQDMIFFGGSRTQDVGAASVVRHSQLESMFFVMRTSRQVVGVRISHKLVRDEKLRPKWNVMIVCTTDDGNAWRPRCR